MSPPNSDARTVRERLGLDTPPRAALPWSTCAWINSPSALTPDALRGRIIVLHAFQMLCPGCVQHALPQAQRLRAVFPEDDVAVIGLHTVFEHHEAMTRTSLEAFVYEYRITYPVGIDAPSVTPGDPVPQTMRAYAMRGTPTLLLYDRSGRLRRHTFGVEEDVVISAAIATLAAEP